MTDHLGQARSALDEATRALLGVGDAATAIDAVRAVAHARASTDLALDEAMAAAVLAGASVRTVAAEAGLAPNSLPPRLATTSSLSAYSSTEGRVGAEGIARARFDVERGLPAPPPPTTGDAEPQRLRFRRRQS